jgi:hypothetical protein
MLSLSASTMAMRAAVSEAGGRIHVRRSGDVDGVEGDADPEEVEIKETSGEDVGDTWDMLLKAAVREMSRTFALGGATKIGLDVGVEVDLRLSASRLRLASALAFIFLCLRKACRGT